MTPQRGEIWWVSLDPTQGAEIRKTRPCLVLSTNTANQHRSTVVVVPLSTAARAYPPITVPITCQGQEVVAVVDQVRAVAKHRLRTCIETATPDTLQTVVSALARILEFSP
ncbi:MAG: type II toxin-antitoxin system PemK/MazF family toxin [Deltaproteobacteria bacterium]|nr:type II toxin-antitoxin system PemK/MazF family toxin [Deltaproteobacteria bacterium]